MGGDSRVLLLQMRAKAAIYRQIMCSGTVACLNYDVYSIIYVLFFSDILLRHEGLSPRHKDVPGVISCSMIICQSDVTKL